MGHATLKQINPGQSGVCIPCIVAVYLTCRWLGNHASLNKHDAKDSATDWDTACRLDVSVRQFWQCTKHTVFMWLKILKGVPHAYANIPENDGGPLRQQTIKLRHVLSKLLRMLHGKAMVIVSQEFNYLTPFWVVCIGQHCTIWN